MAAGWQAIDRAHRMGQARWVPAARLIARDRVEEKVLALRQPTRVRATLTREDLMLLLG